MHRFKHSVRIVPYTLWPGGNLELLIYDSEISETTRTYSYQPLPMTSSRGNNTVSVIKLTLIFLSPHLMPL